MERRYRIHFFLARAWVGQRVAVVLARYLTSNSLTNG